MTAARFNSEFRERKPALITNSPLNAALRSKWTAAWLRDSVGSTPVRLGSPHALANRGEGKNISTLRQFLQNGKGDQIMFERSGFFTHSNATRGMASELTHPPYLTMPGRALVASLQVASPFHVHTSAWLELIAGRKVWSVFSPSESVPFSDFETHERWLEGSGANDMRVCTFTQNPGDIVYIPEGWHHATSNAAEFTFGVGQQRCGYEDRDQECESLPGGFYTDGYYNASQAADQIHELHRSSGLSRMVMHSRADSHIKACLHAQRKYPASFKLREFLGDIYVTLQNTSRALEEYRAAVSLNPKAVMIRMKLAEALGASGLLDKAAEECSRVISGAASSPCDSELQLVGHAEQTLQQITRQKSMKAKVKVKETKEEEFLKKAMHEAQSAQSGLAQA